jgi:hypothetical protein
VGAKVMVERAVRELKQMARRLKVLEVQSGFLINYEGEIKWPPSSTATFRP